MGIRAMLLKPNIVSPTGFTAFDPAKTSTIVSASSSGSTITTAADLSSGVVVGFSGVRTDWILLDQDNDGTFEYFWRITAISGVTVTIDGTLPTTVTNGRNVKILQAVDARCAWTSESTVTHFELEANSLNFSSQNDLTITRFSGRGAVIVNLRNYRDWETDRKSTRLNSSHRSLSRMPSSA